MKLTSEDRITRNRFIRLLKGQLAARSMREAAHASRVAVYSVATGEKLRMSNFDLVELRYAAELHDVGKVGWPTRFFSGAIPVEAAQGHPLNGVRAVASIAWLAASLPAILAHHEHWDGEGYPLGVWGIQIPLAARVISIAEAFDCMTMPSDWRKTVSERQAILEIQRCAGSQFDPTVVEAFLEVQPLVQPVGL